MIKDEIEAVKARARQMLEDKDEEIDKIKQQASQPPSSKAVADDSVHTDNQQVSSLQSLQSGDVDK